MRARWAMIWHCVVTLAPGHCPRVLAGSIVVASSVMTCQFATRSTIHYSANQCALSDHNKHTHTSSLSICLL